MTDSGWTTRIWIVAVALAAVALASCARDPEATARRAVASGDRYFAKGQFPEAIVEYRSALQQNPRLGDARLQLGRSYLAVKDNGNAYREIMRAADLLPDSASAQLQAGQLFLLTGDFDGAKQRAQRVLRKTPSDVDAQILLGNALAGLKDLNGAIVQVEEAIDKDPRRTLTYTNLGALQFAKGDRTAAEATFKRAVTMNPNSVAAHLALANFYWASARPDEAEVELKAGAQLEPASSLVNRTLATFYIQLRRPQDAERYLKSFAEKSSDAAPQLMLADFYLSIGKPKEARAVLMPASRLPDGFTPATLRLAGLDYDEGQHEQAFDGVAAVLKRDPKNNGARLMRARFLLREKHGAEALTLAEAVVASDAKSADGQFVLGMALEANGRADEAARAFQMVVRLQPRALPALLELARLGLQRGDASSALQYSQDAVRAYPQSSSARMALARALVAQGNLTAAETQLTDVVKAAPQLPELQILLGQVYSAKRQFPQARQAFARALEIDRSSTDALAGLLTLDFAEKKADDARARIEARLAALPTNAADWVLAGQTYMVLGNMPRAESSFRKALQVDSGNLLAYEGLAAVYLTEQHLEDAEREFTEIAKREPQSVVAATMVGMILERQNKRIEARQRYEQALVIDPRAPVAANNLAWVYAEDGGNLDVALQLAQTAKSQLPNRHEIDDTLGWIYYKKGLSALAISSLRQSVAGQPGNPSYLYHLGLAYAQGGDKPHAREALERALSLHADFSGAADARKVLGELKG